MLFVEHLQSLVEHRIVLVLDNRRTYADALLLASCGAERNRRHTVMDKLCQEVITRKALPADGEEESVAHVLVQVLVVYDMESVLQEYS